MAAVGLRSVNRCWRSVCSSGGSGGGGVCRDGQVCKLQALAAPYVAVPGQRRRLGRASSCSLRKASTSYSVAKGRTCSNHAQQQQGEQQQEQMASAKSRTESEVHKKKTAIRLGYVGTAYRGLQVNRQCPGES